MAINKKAGKVKVNRQTAKVLGERLWNTGKTSNLQHIVRRFSRTANTTGAAQNTYIGVQGDLGAYIRGLVTSDVYEVRWQTLRAKLLIHADSPGNFVLQSILGCSEPGATLVSVGGLDVTDVGIVDLAYGLEPYEYFYVSKPTLSDCKGGDTPVHYHKGTLDITQAVRRWWKSSSVGEGAEESDLNLLAITHQDQLTAVNVLYYVDLWWEETMNKQTLPLLPN